MRPFLVTVICLVALFVENVPAAPQVVLKRKGKAPVLVERVIFLPSKRAYRVTTAKGVTMTIPGRDVDHVKPPKPVGFDQIASMEELESVYGEHTGDVWAEESFKKLMPLYLEKGEYQKAVSIYERMVPVMGRNMPVAVTYQYWQALLENNRKATLRRKLELAIAGSSRELTAWAYMMTGDLIVAEGDHKKALLDGYMKAALMYAEVKSCRKNVLGKTHRTMAHLGDSRSDKFRKMLAEEFPKTR